jgi:hypothetical protein
MLHFLHPISSSGYEQERSASGSPTLYYGLQHFFLNKAGEFQPNLATYPQHLHEFITEAVDTQGRIGWHLALKDFLRPVPTVAEPAARFARRFCCG